MEYDVSQPLLLRICTSYKHLGHLVDGSYVANLRLRNP